MQGFVEDYNQDLYAYKVQKDGKYFIEVTFSEINETFGKFYHLFVTNKKGISFLGNEGEYLINQTELGSAQVYNSSVILSSRQSGVWLGSIKWYIWFTKRWYYRISYSFLKARYLGCMI